MIKHKRLFVRKKNNMTQIVTQILTKKRTNIVLVILFVFASCTSVFSQSVENAVVTEEVSTHRNTDKVTTVSSRSNTNFILWFMGSKQDPNRVISSEGINTKKDIMTSGLAPNRLLLKAFLKKTVNLESTLV
jgi:ribosomal protein L21